MRLPLRLPALPALLLLPPAQPMRLPLRLPALPALLLLPPRCLHFRWLAGVAVGAAVPSEKATVFADLLIFSILLIC